jgi:predicted  nucleic acid-binding Zn-ribbon protein
LIRRVPDLRQTQMARQAARTAREISDLTIKVQEMEAQIRAYEIENAELQDRVSILETESNNLLSQIHDLEYDKEQGKSQDQAFLRTRYLFITKALIQRRVPLAT